MVIGYALHDRCGEPILSLTLNGLVDVGETRERHDDVLRSIYLGRLMTTIPDEFPRCFSAFNAPPIFDPQLREEGTIKSMSVLPKVGLALSGMVAFGAYTASNQYPTLPFKSKQRVASVGMHISRIKDGPQVEYRL
jgi:hypothetical protein